MDLANFVAKSASWPQPISSYSPTSFTRTARVVLERLIQNEDLAKFDSRFQKKAMSLLEKIPLLDRLPPVLSHGDFTEINILVSPEGNVTGVIDFEGAKTEAFGMCLYGIYEGFLGVMRHRKWTFFDQDADDGSGRSVRSILETAFWETLWAALPSHITRSIFEEAVILAMEIGIVNRYFVRGLLTQVDLESEDHRISLEFARGIFLDR